jgi:hypothetical protein
MQRVLILVVMLALVVVSLALGAAAAHLPFWQRAWGWHVARDGWPQSLPGPVVELAPAPAGRALPLRVRADLPAPVGAQTQLLMVAAADGSVRGWFAAGLDQTSLIEGRELASGLLPPLYGALLARERSGLLDEPIGPVLQAWIGDARGAITPRQLFWQLSGLSTGHFVALNPLNTRAQLASGPSFSRAAMSARLAYPPGSHFMPEPVNSQLLALVAAQVSKQTFAVLLQEQIWSRVAAYPGIALLDHRRGEIAAHCCIQAVAEDWLRVALLLAKGGNANGQRIFDATFLAQMLLESPVSPGNGLGYTVHAAASGEKMLRLDATGRVLIAAPVSGRALLWVGEGSAPTDLEQMLLSATLAADSMQDN